jgi:periplasmic divalent cation tolerance protein
MAGAGENQPDRSTTDLPTDVLVVLCTCPDAPTAARLAGELVERRLAACVNVLPEIRSIYRWQGGIQDDGEALMMVKTSRSAYAQLESWLADHHPYDVPEILALPVARGSAAYLDWVEDETGSE